MSLIEMVERRRMEERYGRLDIDDFATRKMQDGDRLDWWTSEERREQCRKAQQAYRLRKLKEAQDAERAP